MLLSFLYKKDTYKFIKVFLFIVYLYTFQSNKSEMKLRETSENNVEFVVGEWIERYVMWKMNNEHEQY